MQAMEKKGIPIFVDLLAVLVKYCTAIDLFCFCWTHRFCSPLGPEKSLVIEMSKVWSKVCVKRIVFNFLQAHYICFSSSKLSHNHFSSMLP